MNQSEEFRIAEHEKLCKQIHDLYLAKNADYGDSFRKVREEIPNAILVRLSDKLNRLKKLMNTSEEQQVKEESVDDTLMDLANYALLELVERHVESDPEKDDEIGFDANDFLDAMNKCADSFRQFGYSLARSTCLSDEEEHLEVYLKPTDLKGQYQVTLFVFDKDGNIKSYKHVVLDPSSGEEPGRIEIIPEKVFGEDDD